ncbi:hypothetical protein KSF_009060 [Reticulibacter mediterranei]|uniref:Uncharacterized protein n=1 Tax=Reticulibacter mediterranei TaxID=2778369 RepID=A0A8J3IC50_9CHLR|nr:hypothetical protein [Reticulibacter mediterranei]GHO90858.1 hypothetical protein KSF_009060 [Reticulibacter mediterranei]
MSKELSTMSKKLDQKSILSFLIQHGYATIVEQLTTPGGEHPPDFYIELVNGLLEQPEFAHLPVMVDENVRWLRLKEFATRCATFAVIGAENGRQVRQIQRQDGEKVALHDYYQPGLRAGWSLLDAPEGRADWEIVAYRAWYEHGFAREWNEGTTADKQEIYATGEIDPAFLERLHEELEKSIRDTSSS